jgi:N-acetylglucosamine-6-phosphate deacetylase
LNRTSPYPQVILVIFLPVDASFVDLHIHGAFGVDVLTADDEGLELLSRGLESRGVSAYLPTLVPVRMEELRGAVRRLSSYMRARTPGDGRGAMPLGLHFEGPFVSTSRCGALHTDRFLDARDSRRVAEFFEALGAPVGRSMTTLAPEIDGGVELVQEFVRRGFVVSIGHTAAPASVLDRALESGARHMTHFANAMNPLHHREVGAIGWGLLHDEVTVDVIADLVHLSPEMLRLVYKTKGASRVALISDAIPPAGLPDGSYPVWGEEVTVTHGTARNRHGSLAGSVSLLDTAVASLASIGVPEEDARRSAGEVPLRILGLLPS